MAGEVRQNKKEAVKEMEVLKKAKEFLSQEKILIDQNFTEDEKEILNGYQLLTFKPRLYLLNGKEEEVSGEVLDIFKKNNWQYLIIDVATEFEAEGLTREERKELGLPRDFRNRYFS